ncbi:MAG: ArsA family ATPase, partial [Chloroflexi bacterium]|nr:ArsA family ATPase [Chloroflexota bacterium]
ETLRLLSFPEILHWWVDKMFPIGRTATNLIRPFVRPVLDIPLPDKEVFDSAKTLFDDLDAMHHLLTNPGISSARIIVNPEKMVVREAQRLFTYLNLYGYFTDLIICNRLIPEEVQDSYFVFWKESQANYLNVIKESFAPLPIFTVPMFNQEVIGIDRLKIMGRAIYGDNDPAQFFFRGQAQKFIKQNGNYQIKIDLPFAEKEKVSVIRSGDELVIEVGVFKRNIVLPRMLADSEVKGAKFESGSLTITFGNTSVQKEPSKEAKKDGKNI